MFLKFFCFTNCPHKSLYFLEFQTFYSLFCYPLCSLFEGASQSYCASLYCCSTSSNCWCCDNGCCSRSDIEHCIQEEKSYMYKTVCYVSSTKFSVCELCILYFCCDGEKSHTSFQNSLSYSSIFYAINDAPECFTDISFIHALEMESVLLFSYSHKCIQMP